MDPGALGWRSHSGWAVLVALSMPPGGHVVIVHRERVELLDGSLPQQPYHAAAEDGYSLEEGVRLISDVVKAATSAAATATEAAVAALGRSGYTISGIGVVAAEREIPSDLKRILAAHPLLHAAEGQLYEHAVIEGSARTGLPVITMAPKTIFEDAAKTMSMTVEDLGAILSAAGKAAGPPWQKDHREAAAAALVALSAQPFA